MKTCGSGYVIRGRDPTLGTTLRDDDKWPLSGEHSHAIGPPDPVDREIR
ncbi:hypothetical protein R1521_34185 [Rhizobium brockwellii]|uniref:Uncharacterized protein n=1 Tax=Rhizobium brockwellii TaxID=3019932 RepID=A0ABU3YXG5_9HYPH|nr:MULTISPECIES: hypothetical protein [Rhizobium]MDV4183523.1 hypothetical protein [Rhizobium brockwellii]MDV4190534.1 hypothetical protein [Rhizobium brockwellii]